MKKKIIQFNDYGARELDRIVSQVLNAIDVEVRNRLGMDDPMESWSEDEYEVGVEPDEILHSDEQESAEKQPIVSKKPGSAKLTSRDKPVILDIDDVRKQNGDKQTLSAPSEWDNTSPELEIQLSHDDSVLFDEHEEAFIARAVTFLRQRDNKDTIISRIWNHITEAEPDTFYSPETEESMDEAPHETPSDFSQDAPDKTRLEGDDDAESEGPQEP